MSYTDESINHLIDQAITLLADDSIDAGVGVLEEMAQVWAKAGLPIETFYNIRTYIINEAKERTDSYFIDEKIKLGERRMRDARIYSTTGKAAH